MVRNCTPRSLSHTRESGVCWTPIGDEQPNRWIRSILVVDVVGEKGAQGKKVEESEWAASCFMVGWSQVLRDTSPPLPMLLLFPPGLTTSSTLLSPSSAKKVPHTSVYGLLHHGLWSTFVGDT